MSTKHATHAHNPTSEAQPETPQPEPTPPPPPTAETTGTSTYQCSSTVSAAVDDQVFWNTKIVGA